MFTYQESVSKGAPKPCTKEIWDRLIDSPVVKNICKQIAALDASAADYNEKKQALKKRLPIIIPHAGSFKNGRRVSADAVPSGLAMLDVDHVEEPRLFVEQNKYFAELHNQTVEEYYRERGIVLVAITASGKGLRVIGARQNGESIEAAQMRMAEALGISEYDAVTKDLARASYVVPRDYLLWMDEEKMFAPLEQDPSLGFVPHSGFDNSNSSTYAPSGCSMHRPTPTAVQCRSEQLLSRREGGELSERGGSELMLREADEKKESEGKGSELMLREADEKKEKEKGSSELMLREADEKKEKEGEGSVLMLREADEKKESEGGGSELMLREADELTYRGIPYGEIVEQLMLEMGNAGGAEQGERNTVYFGLANYMRYICDFDKELLLRVLPDFGLSEQERRQAITSALGRPRKSQMPIVVQSALAVCEREHELLADKPALPKASEMALPQLPKLLRILCKRLPEDYRPAMIIASLPVLGTLATRIRFEYLDRQEQSLSFFSCITAPAASGKSFIRKPVDLLLTPINEQDAIEREKEQKYKEKLRASKNSKMQPEDPHACPRNNGISISIAKLLQLMTYAEGKHLIAIGEEMDTLVKSEKAGAWSQKSDIYRLAFDNAEYGQAYMSETSFNAHIRVYYNLLLTGTPNSMKRFFKDLENGLATRVCFAQLPDTSFTEIPVFAPYSEAEKAEIIRWSRRLDTEQGTITCKSVSKAISRWLEAKRQEALDADNHAMDTFRRRAAVIGYRAGMLCYLLEDRKDTEVVAPFAEWVAEYVFRNQMELWGEQMEQLAAGELERTEKGTASSLLAILPKEFTTNDLIQLRVKKGQSVSRNSIKTLLFRWKSNGRITRLSESHWKQMG